MLPKIILDAAHAGQLTDLRDISVVDQLMRNWKFEHHTDGTLCPCIPSYNDGMVVHNFYGVDYERN